MVYHSTAAITRCFFDANSQLITDTIEVGSNAVKEDDQRTMHQYFLDVVNARLAPPDTLTHTEGPWFYDGKTK